ncbi:MAG: beta-ketoacyl-[acyl-carrier-protein] synthase II [Hyphomonadaceae bacterium]|nr:beta-ketoacyl-[acyl-carrier-protein] synthase II [Hyphomonadaceae bacterium]
MSRIYINDFAVMSRLGMSRAETLSNLSLQAPPRPDIVFELNDGQSTRVAVLPSDLPAETAGRTRTNQIASALLEQLAPTLDRMKSAYAPDRVAIIVGTSTTGIEEALTGLGSRLSQGFWDEDYQFADQELGDLADHIRRQTGFEGPCYTISTACTSSTKAIISAARLLRTGLADAVICGGVDSLSSLTVNGFHALSSVSAGQCSPYGADRDGINIGEGGGLFILSHAPSDWAVLGGAESSDAYHVSSPDPEGQQAESAVRAALQQAGLSLEEVDFVHMHGTGTKLNDQAEGQLVMRVFGPDMPAMSTKGMTGHTLGAAGAIQAALNLICMESGIYPPHVYDAPSDPELPVIRLTHPQEKASTRLDASLCVSYAFGGSNAVIVLGRV